MLPKVCVGRMQIWARAGGEGREGGRGLARGDHPPSGRATIAPGLLGPRIEGFRLWIGVDWRGRQKGPALKGRGGVEGGRGLRARTGGGGEGGRGLARGDPPPQAGGQYLLGSWAARARLEPGLSSPAGLQKQRKQRKIKQIGARSAPEKFWGVWDPKARGNKGK